jgi:hypothetical protein
MRDYIRCLVIPDYFSWVFYCEVYPMPQATRRLFFVIALGAAILTLNIYLVLQGKYPFQQTPGDHHLAHSLILR